MFGWLSPDKLGIVPQKSLVTTYSADVCLVHFGEICLKTGIVVSNVYVDVCLIVFNAMFVW